MVALLFPETSLPKVEVLLQPRLVTLCLLQAGALIQPKLQLLPQQDRLCKPPLFAQLLRDDGQAAMQHARQNNTCLAYIRQCKHKAMLPDLHQLLLTQHTQSNKSD